VTLTEFCANQSTDCCMRRCQMSAT